MFVRFDKEVRNSLAGEIKKMAWWLTGGSAVSSALLDTPLWVIISSLAAWVVLQGIAHFVLSLNDETDKQRWWQ